MNLQKDLAGLQELSVGGLRERYAEVLGEPTRSHHRAYLLRRVAWRLQARAEGGLTERALARAEELADDADVRLTAPREPKPGPTGPTVRVPVTGDTRLPVPGTVLTRQYRNRAISVTVLADGFEYLGERYKSLSAVAKVVTGTHVNGFRFFNLGAPE